MWLCLCMCVLCVCMSISVKQKQNPNVSGIPQAAPQVFLASAVSEVPDLFSPSRLPSGSNQRHTGVTHDPYFLLTRVPLTSHPWLPSRLWGENLWDPFAAHTYTTWEFWGVNVPQGKAFTNEIQKVRGKCSSFLWVDCPGIWYFTPSTWETALENQAVSWTCYQGRGGQLGNVPLNWLNLPCLLDPLSPHFCFLELHFLKNKHMSPLPQTPGLGIPR